MRWYMLRTRALLAQTAIWAMAYLVASTPSVARGQTVQLPSFGGFSVRTSVLVPDRGGMYLGGVGRSYYGPRRFGVPGVGRLPGAGRLAGSRVASGGSLASGASVHVQVIDHAALDQAVLAEAARRRQATGHETVGRSTTDGRSRHVVSADRVAAAEGVQSVAEIRRQNTERKRVQHQQAKEFAVQGRQAAVEGHVGAARIYYQMAFRRGDSTLQQQMLAELEKLK